ncbi:hypothetical protein MJO28_017635 [Puccinia striiformis f. sp. tritici]|nr:hypothetical protein MJO28_017635 [Puccinia striiformis f. sp. tritici]
MSTRRTVSADQLLPLADPEAILRQARAERRRLAQQLLPFLTTEDPPPDATNPSLIPLPHSPTVPATAETTNQPLPLPTIIEPTPSPSSPINHSIDDTAQAPVDSPETTPFQTPLENSLILDPILPTTPTRPSTPPQNSPHPELPSPFLKRPLAMNDPVTSANTPNGGTTGQPPASGTTPTNKGNENPAAGQPSAIGVTPTTSSEENLAGLPDPPAHNAAVSTKEFVRILLASQQAAVKQSMSDHQNYVARLAHMEADNADRLGRLEEALIHLAVKREDSRPPSAAVDDDIDLRCLRIADGPVYTGPYQEIEPFLLWIQTVQIFFVSKGITKDRTKIIVTGGLIKETNLTSFYANEYERLAMGSWTAFKDEIFASALPSQWRTDLRKLLRFLRMGDNESFNQFATRARTLQQMVNFDSPSHSDFDLAENIAFGVTEDLQDRITERELLSVKPFVFADFVRRANDSYNALPKKAPSRSRSFNPSSSSATPTTSQTPMIDKEEYVWRIHSYLDSVGKCHFCKQRCGNPAGACPGPMDRTRVFIPPSFAVPKKPANYIAPRAWTPAGTSQPSTPAGRSSARPAGVAGIADDTLFPELDDQSAAALEELDHLVSVSSLSLMDDEREAASRDEQLLGSYDGIDPASVNALWAIPEDFPSDEEYVSPRPSALSPLHQFHAGRCLRGVVKLGSRINLPITRRARSTTRARRTTNNYDTSFAIPLHSTVPTVLLCPRLPWPTGTADHITTPLPASVHHHHTQRPPHHPSPPSLTLKEHVTRTHQYLSNCDEHRTANRRHPNSVLPTGKRSLCHNQTTAPTLRLAHGPPPLSPPLPPSSAEIIVSPELEIIVSPELVVKYIPHSVLASENLETLGLLLCQLARTNSEGNSSLTGSPRA